MNGRVVLLLALMAMSFASIANAADSVPSLGMGTASAQPGTQVSLPVTFSAGSTPVTSLQFSLTLPVGWTLNSATSSPSAGKTAAVNSAHGTVLLYGLNQTPMGSGSVATVTLRIPSGAVPALYPVTINSAAFSTSTGGLASPGSSTAGSVQIGGSGSGSASLGSTLDNVRVYPNPWRSGKSQVRHIMFDQMPEGSHVKVFTISGHKVRSLDGSTGTAVWDLSDDSGSRVASGIYLYLVSDASGNHLRGKVVVIR